MSNTLFEAAEIPLMRTYYEKVKKGSYLENNPDLSTKQASDNYNSFINQVGRIQPKEYFQEDFKKIAKTEQISFEIIVQIFGYSLEILNEMREFFSKCYVSNNRSIFSGVCIHTINPQTNKKETAVELPSINNLSSIISIVHEFIHYHIDKFNIALNKKYYYEEILSIYAEKLATKYLMELKIQQDLEKKIEQTRLEGIKWHYYDNPQDENNLILMYKSTLFASQFDPRAREFVKQAEASLPWLKNEKDAIAHELYQTALAQSYGFGYLYGESLLHYDLNDSKTRQKIRDVLNGNTNIQDLLDYFNISLKNPETIEIAKQKINKIK